VAGGQRHLLERLESENETRAQADKAWAETGSRARSSANGIKWTVTVIQDVAVVEDGGLLKTKTTTIQVTAVAYTTMCFGCGMVPDIDSLVLHEKLAMAGVPITHLFGPTP
jgi:hypothetical protein